MQYAGDSNHPCTLIAPLHLIGALFLLMIAFYSIIDFHLVGAFGCKTGASRKIIRKISNSHNHFYTLSSTHITYIMHLKYKKTPINGVFLYLAFVLYV